MSLFHLVLKYQFELDMISQLGSCFLVVIEENPNPSDLLPLISSVSHVLALNLFFKEGPPEVLRS